MSTQETLAFLDAINREAWGADDCPETLRCPPSEPVTERAIQVEVTS